MHDCCRFKKLIYFVTALFVSVGVSGCATTQNTAPTGPSAQTAARAEKTVASAQAKSLEYKGSGVVPYYPAPERIDLCGEPVPLESQEVRERFDKEFTLVVYNHAQVYRWLKRKERLFPWVEESLRRLNLPEDLKYVAIAEIDPSPNAPGQRKSVDRLYDFEGSTDSALMYLGNLYRNYNSWALAIAAYNCGEKRIMDESRAQGVRDYYHMELPLDTERYVFRILAIKAVLSDPARYGYELPKRAEYR
jgi:hypothetical protein